jgi:hypothetical protein
MSRMALLCLQRWCRSRTPVFELVVEVGVFGRDLGLGDQGDLLVSQLAGAQDDAVPAAKALILLG